jgi:hypothetical protein
MIYWRSILNKKGIVVAPYNRLLALKVGWKDEELGDLYHIYPVRITLEHERDEPGGRLYSYPMVYSAINDESLDIFPEDLGEQHKWCFWEEFVAGAKL